MGRGLGQDEQTRAGAGLLNTHDKKGRDCVVSLKGTRDVVVTTKKERAGGNKECRAAVRGCFNKEGLIRRKAGNTVRHRDYFSRKGEKKMER